MHGWPPERHASHTYICTRTWESTVRIFANTRARTKEWRPIRPGVFVMVSLVEAAEADGRALNPASMCSDGSIGWGVGDDMKRWRN